MGVAQAIQVAGHQGEQVAGLGEGIFPNSVVASFFQVALLDGIAVGKQHRIVRPIRFDAHPVPGHDVGPVGEVGDPAKTLRLALGAVHAVGHVQAFQTGVVLRPDTGDHLQIEGIRHGLDHQRFGLQTIFSRCQRSFVQDDRDQFHVLTVQDQRRLDGIGIRIPA